MFLTDGVSAITTSDFQSVLSTLQAQISVSTIVGVLTTAAAAAIGMVFMWWGVRKVAQVLMSAFRKGKISL